MSDSDSQSTSNTPFLEGDIGGDVGIPRAPVDPITFDRPRDCRKRIVVCMGKVGAGKSSILGCITGYADQGIPGWREGNAEIVTRHININGMDEEGTFQTEIYDANGFHGNLKEDWHILRKLIEDLKKDTAKVDCVLLCLSSSRFTAADRSIIKMLRDFTTPQFRSLIRVVITHAHPNLLRSEEFMEDVTNNLAMLSSREEVVKRAIFVDLMHENLFKEGSAARQEVRQCWALTQKRFYDMIRASESRVLVKDILATPFWFEAVLVYKVEVALFFSLVIIGILLYSYLASYDLSLDRLDQIQKCMAEVGKLKAMQQPGMEPFKTLDWLQKAISLFRK